MASLIPFISTSDEHEYRWYQISEMILTEIYPNRIEDKINIFQLSKIKHLAGELKTYGFLTTNYIPPVPENGNNGFPSMIMRRGDEYRLIYSEKLERYKYWLNVNGKMPKYIEIDEKSE